MQAFRPLECDEVPHTKYTTGMQDEFKKVLKDLTGKEYVLTRGQGKGGNSHSEKEGRWKTSDQYEDTSLSFQWRNIKEKTGIFHLCLT